MFVLNYLQSWFDQTSAQARQQLESQFTSVFGVAPVVTPETPEKKKAGTREAGKREGGNKGLYLYHRNTNTADIKNWAD